MKSYEHTTPAREATQSQKRSQDEEAGFLPSVMAITSPLQWCSAVGPVFGRSGRGVLLTDNEGTIEYANERLASIVGYRHDELRGRNPRLFQSGFTSQKTYRELWNTVSSGRSWRSVLRNRRRNGEVFSEELIVTPLTDERGCITHFFGEVRELEANVARSKAVSLDSEFEKRALISEGLAHELGNALLAVEGSCALLRHEADPAILKRVDAVARSASRLMGFSKKLALCAGREIRHANRFDLRETVVDILDRLESTTDLSCVSTSLAEQPLHLSGDSSAIGRAVHEIVVNALEAARGRDGDIQVSVSLGGWDGAVPKEGEVAYDFGLPFGPCAVVTVSDQGSGMDDYLVSIASELFFSTKSVHHGLGLPMAVGACRSHGGAFQLGSKPRVGTVVRMLFPLASRRTDSFHH